MEDEGFRLLRERANNRFHCSDPLECLYESVDHECDHEGIDTEEAFVCKKCGLVLDNIYLPDVNWFEHAMPARIYSDVDRLQAVNKNLIRFMEKAGLQRSLYIIQERMRVMKINCCYQSLNYAIALACIFKGDEEVQRQLEQFLPRSNVSWVRSMRIGFDSDHFFQLWRNNLMKQTSKRSLNDNQKEKIFQTMDKLKMEVSRQDFEDQPMRVQHALYRFADALSK